MKNRTRYPQTLAQLQQECPNKLRRILPEDASQLNYADARQRSPDALLFTNSLARQ